MNFPTRLVEDAVTEIARLPGIGKKTAMRLTLHLLKADESRTVDLASALINLRTKTRYCTNCQHISEEELCHICSGIRRDRSTICVVEDSRDVLAIEETAQYQGLYHVLGGIIAPMAGIGPEELNIDRLIERAASDEVKEVILAISPTMEGDTTAFYLSKKLNVCSVKISSIARGIPLGGELEYADSLTLGRSILTRTDYQ
ncbi:MAG TPA: recombination mediator RecR [Catalimonadaceae bacterium]|nr:recombination mediator RecR [Catalimonadaceae bacterium]HPI10759.1 recombination mediator RecR [Catalimonadaceae bacterium]